MKRTACLLILALFAAPVLADVKYTRLDEDQFIIEHRKQTTWGAEAKATKTLYEEVASICIAAGYDYFLVKSQQVGQRQHGGLWGGGRGASGTIEAKFYRDEGEEDSDRIKCEPLSNPKKVEKAKKKLAKEKK